MKNSVSNIWLLGIIIFFILIFAAYIAITISYTQSFKYKNEILNIIEKHHGMTDDSSGESVGSLIKSGENVTAGVGALQTISLYLRGNAYTATGSCPKDDNTWYGVSEMTWDGNQAGAVVEEAKDGQKYYYCFSKYGTGKISRYSTVYYKVRLFYKFEFPVLSEFLSIKVEGMTDEIYNPVDDDFYQNGDVFSKEANN